MARRLMDPGAPDAADGDAADGDVRRVVARVASVKRLRGSQRREQLLDVALTVFARRGFSATTMDDIAEAAGVTKPLLYQHFDSKRALYLELVDSVAKAMLEGIATAAASADGPRQQVEWGVAAYFHVVVAHADAFRLLIGSDVPDDPELSRAVRHVEDSMAEAIAERIDAGLDDDHRRLLAHAVVGMAQGASRYFLDTHRGPPADGTDVDALARRIGDLAWAGLRSVHRD